MNGKRKKARQMADNSEFFVVPALVDSPYRLALLWVREYIYASMVIMRSGITGIGDKYAARKFNMVSDIGKALDLLADKLTQAAALTCPGLCL